MRCLMIALALAACAPVDAPEPPTGPHVADSTECPLIGQPGTVGATWVPQIGCAYQCSPRARICGSRFEGGLIVGGECASYDSREHCGECGMACASDEVCVPRGARWYCLGRGAI